MRRKRSVCVLASCLFTVNLTLITGAAAHPQHVSIAEARWNAKSNSLEIALKVHPHDLERALRKKSGRRVVLETTPQVDRLITQYLAQAFVFQQADGRRAKLKWVGKEISVKAGWLYFEVPLRGSPQGATVSNRMFFELLDDQVNTINVRWGPRRKSLSFTRQQSAKKLRLDLPVSDP